MKKCSTCDVSKSLKEFNRKAINKDGLERYCKDCHRKHNVNHYAANKVAYKQNALKHKRLLRAWFVELKKTLSCMECGEMKYWRLAFHHRNSKTKDTEVSQMITDHASKNRILKEIDKCNVLCHNCHSDVHHANRGVV